MRKHDYESFLVSQFYPKEQQGGYFALKAFSVSRAVYAVQAGLTCPQVELAMVHDNVSTQMIGKMRMQFWRDAVKGIADVRCLLFQL